MTAPKDETKLNANESYNPRRRSLTEAEARAAYGVCARLCGASKRISDEDAAVRYLTDPSGYPHEWRFVGMLGMGGKLRLNGNRDGAPHVTCYPEDETPQRERIIKLANEQIREAIR